MAHLRQEEASPQPDEDTPLPEGYVNKLLGTWQHSKGGNVVIEFAEDESSLRITNPSTGSLTLLISDFVTGIGKLRYYRLRGEVSEDQITWENSTTWTKIASGAGPGSELKTPDAFDFIARMQHVLAGHKDPHAPAEDPLAHADIQPFPHAPWNRPQASGATTPAPSFASQLRSVSHRRDGEQRQGVVEQREEPVEQRECKVEQGADPAWRGASFASGLRATVDSRRISGKQQRESSAERGATGLALETARKHAAQGKRRSDSPVDRPAAKRRLDGNASDYSDWGPAQVGGDPVVNDDLESVASTSEDTIEPIEPVSPSELCAQASDTAPQDPYDGDFDDKFRDNACKVFDSRDCQEDIDDRLFHTTQRPLVVKMEEVKNREAGIEGIYTLAYDFVTAGHVAHAQSSHKQLQEAVLALSTALMEADNLFQVMERALRDMCTDGVKVMANAVYKTNWEVCHEVYNNLLIKVPVVQKNFDDFCHYVRETEAASAEKQQCGRKEKRGEGHHRSTRSTDPFAAALRVRGVIVDHEGDRLGSGEDEGAETPCSRPRLTRKAVDKKLHCPLVPLNKTTTDDASTDALSQPKRERPLCHKHKLSVKIYKSKAGQLFFCCPFTEAEGGCGFQRWIGKRPNKKAGDDDGNGGQ